MTEPNGIKIGYARISTDDQRMDLQIDALVASGVPLERIYQERVSGSNTRRLQLEECLKALRASDTLVIYKLDRLGRSLVELIKIINDLEAKGIKLHSLFDQIDTSTAVGRVMFHMLGAFAQFERDIISERTKAGMKAARARGHRGGRKTKINNTMLKGIVAMLSDPTVTMDEVSKTFKVSRSTIQRALARERDKSNLKALREKEKLTKRMAKKAPPRSIIEDLV